MIQLCENSCFCEEIESSRQEAQPSDSHHGPVKMETRATRGGLQCLRKNREHEEAEGQRGGRGRISSNIRLRVIRVIEAEGSRYKSRSLCNKLSNGNSKVCSAVHWSDILYCLYCVVKVFCAPHYVFPIISNHPSRRQGKRYLCQTCLCCRSGVTLARKLFTGFLILKFKYTTNGH